MNTSRRLFLRTPLAILVLLFATVSVAWGAPISLRYVGTGYDTTVDNLDDGFPVNISIADAKGSFGASKLEITGEWMPGNFVGIECEADYFELVLLFSASVPTFENQSQLFAFSNHGWMCVNQTTGHYYGQAFGAYIGGTGQFVGATGEWTTDFSGFFLEPPALKTIGFRSMEGVVKGKVDLP